MDENIINYIPEDAPPPFRLFRSKEVEFGLFFVLRSLFAYDCEGRNWQQNTVAILTGLLVPAALGLDLCGIVVWCFCKIFVYIFCGVWNLILECIKNGFYNSVGVLLKIITVLISFLIIYYKWDVIINFVKGLF